MKAFFEGIEGISALDVILYAPSSSKLGFFILFVAVIVTAVLAFIRYSRGGPRLMLLAIGLGAAGLGLLLSLLSASFIQQASEATGITDIRIMAPSIYEIVLLVGGSLVVGLITLIGAAFSTTKRVS
ncbi:MAG: hypothetical protein QM667_11965 [Asticcacaulis sp.]